MFRSLAVRCFLRAVASVALIASAAALAPGASTFTQDRDWTGVDRLSLDLPQLPQNGPSTLPINKQGPSERTDIYIPIPTAAWTGIGLLTLLFIYRRVKRRRQHWP